MTILAGQVLTAADFNLAAKSGEIVGWAQRISNSSASSSTTDVAVLELPDIAITAGRLYEIFTSPLRLDTGVANDVAMARIRYTTDGSTPSVSSTVLPGGQAEAVLANVTFGEDRVISTTYVPAADETLSLLLCVSRQTGSGSITVIADGSATLCELKVRDCGVSAGDTGVDR